MKPYTKAVFNKKLEFLDPNSTNKHRDNNNNNVPADHRIKLKECEKKDKYLDLARELKNLWNMK